MPQSLSAVHVHLVFSTKERRPRLRDAEIRRELHTYLGGVSRELGCPPFQVGVVADHVHVLARLGRTTTQADWVKELKRSSSLWIKEKTPSLAAFQWQAGYSCFSVSHSNLAQVMDYVVHQEEHHRTLNFDDELRALLRKHEIEFDEKYLWD